MAQDKHTRQDDAEGKGQGFSLPEAPVNPFRVPEGYFDTLPERVKARLDETPEKKNIFPIGYPVFFKAAAVVLLAVAVGWVLSVFLMPGRGEVQEPQTAYEYLEQEMTGITPAAEDELIATLSTIADEPSSEGAEFEETGLFYYTGSETGNTAKDTITHAAILEYLEEEYSYQDLLTDL